MATTAGKPLRGSTCLLVLGMHRSGTSAMTRVANILGAALPRVIMPPVKGNNEVGFWEPWDIVKEHDALLEEVGSRWDDVRFMPEDAFAGRKSARARRRIRDLLVEDFSNEPLFVIKDPRISRLTPLWLPLLRELGASPKIVCMLRHPMEVAASLRDRDGFGKHKALLLWLHHTLEAEKATRRCVRAVVTFADLLEDWRRVTSRLADQLRIEWPRDIEQSAQTIEGFLDPKHRHHSRKTALRLDMHDLGRWVETTYEAMSLHSGELSQPRVRGALDRVRNELADSLSLWDPVLTETFAEVDEATRKLAELEERYRLAEANLVRAVEASASGESALAEQNRLRESLRQAEEALEAERVRARERDQSAETISALQGYLSRVEKSLEQRTTVAEASTIEAAELRTRLETATGDHARVRAGLEQERERLRREKLALEWESRRLQQERERLGRDNAALEWESRRLEQEKLALEQELRSRFELTESAAARVTELERRQDVSLARLASLQKSRRAVEKSLQEALAEVENVRRSSAALASSAADRRARLAGLKLSMLALQAAADESRLQQEALLDRQEALRAVVVEGQRRSGEVSEKLRRALRDLDNERASRERLAAELHSIHGSRMWRTWTAYHRWLRRPLGRLAASLRSGPAAHSALTSEEGASTEASGEESDRAQDAVLGDEPARVRMPEGGRRLRVLYVGRPPVDPSTWSEELLRCCAGVELTVVCVVEDATTETLVRDALAHAEIELLFSRAAAAAGGANGLRALVDDVLNRSGTGILLVDSGDLSVVALPPRAGMTTYVRSGAHLYEADHGPRGVRWSRSPASSDVGASSWITVSRPPRLVAERARRNGAAPVPSVLRERWQERGHGHRSEAAAEPSRDLGDSPSAVTASVIIPTLDGGAPLHRALRSIGEQETDFSFELICIDSGSAPEDLEQMVAAGAKILPIRKQDFDHGLTRDHAAAAAGGQILVFLTQDAAPLDCWWLQRLVDGLLRAPPHVAAVQGGIRETTPQEQRFYWDSCGDRFYFTSESRDWIRRYFGVGFSDVNSAIRAQVFQRFSFESAPFMEDKLWQKKVVGAGYRIIPCLEAAVDHSHDYDLGSLVFRCANEGFGWRLVGEEYGIGTMLADMFRPRVLVDLGRGLARQRVSTMAELLYPFLRPVLLYWGNHAQKRPYH